MVLGFHGRTSLCIIVLLYIFFHIQLFFIVNMLLFITYIVNMLLFTTYIVN
jgi:hypothetical protein